LENRRFGEKSACAPEHGRNEHKEARLPNEPQRGILIAAKIFRIVRQGGSLK